MKCAALLLAIAIAGAAHGNEYLIIDATAASTAGCELGSDSLQAGTRYLQSIPLGGLTTPYNSGIEGRYQLASWGSGAEQALPFTCTSSLCDSHSSRRPVMRQKYTINGTREQVGCGGDWPLSHVNDGCECMCKSKVTFNLEPC